MTLPITTAPAATARAMHAAEMRGQDMQDAPERIYRHPGFKAEFVTAIPFDRTGILATTYITEAECQRRIDTAVMAEREACAWTSQSFLVGDPKNGIPLRSPMPSEIAAAIRARGQK